MADNARGFALLGLPDTWQTTELGYNSLGTDIGGPMSLGEEYRWNTPTIVYAFDESFLNYFGSNGVIEVEKAIKILNGVPAVSRMSSDLHEFPTDSKRVNFEAQALGLLDLKSMALTLLVEELGLAEPERYTWTLRDRKVFSNPDQTNYLVITRNYDPVTFEPTPYVNGTLYTYQVFEPIKPGDYSEAVEIVVDPLAFSFTSVASGYRYLQGGEFFTGLTRDDVGGLRYLLRPDNYNVENLPTNTVVSASNNNSTWSPALGSLLLGLTNGTGSSTIGLTNGTGSSTNLAPALRPGVDRCRFVRGRYDSLLGQGFFPMTNKFTDTIVTNSAKVRRTASRLILQPDILFTAEDLGTFANSVQPILVKRSVGFVNNDPLNGHTTQAGPGVIEGPITISFTTLLPFLINNVNAFFLPTQENAFFNSVQAWGSFDGTTNTPVVYPNGTDIKNLERQVLKR